MKAFLSNKSIDSTKIDKWTSFIHQWGLDENNFFKI